MFRLGKCNACFDELLRMRRRAGEGFGGRSSQVSRAAAEFTAAFDSHFRDQRVL